MPRKPPVNTDVKEEGKEVQDPQPNIVEVEINLTLINNKLNYIMAKLDQLTQAKEE